MDYKNGAVLLGNLPIEVQHFIRYTHKYSTDERKSTALKGGELVTDMKRVTISIPDEIDDAVFELRKTNNFCRCSYSEIVRRLIARGLELMEQDKEGGRNAD